MLISRTAFSIPFLVAVACSSGDASDHGTQIIGPDRAGAAGHVVTTSAGAGGSKATAGGATTFGGSAPSAGNSAVAGASGATTGVAGAPAVDADATCHAQAAEACVQCCGTRHPSGLMANTQAISACACGGACTSSCVSDCQSGKAGQACIACLQSGYTSGACSNALCDADPDCALYGDCADGCNPATGAAGQTGAGGQVGAGGTTGTTGSGGPTSAGIHALSSPAGAFSISVPSGYAATTATPLLIILHGQTATGDNTGAGDQFLQQWITGGYPAATLVASPDDNSDTATVALFDYLKTQYDIDTKRGFVYGYSQGGAYAAFLLYDASTANRFAGVLLNASGLAEDPSEIPNATPASPAVAIVIDPTDPNNTGSLDGSTHETIMQDFATLMMNKGYQTKLTLTNAGHMPSHPEVDDALTFLFAHPKP